jgi:phosphate starvation-inducible PhoH-like protein
MARKTRSKRISEPVTPELEHEVNEREAADRDTSPIEAKTEAQGHYLLAMKESVVTFGVGPAGTGKTYLAAAMAAQALLEKRVSKILITRPAVEAGEELGFLPGTLEEKFDPYFRPVRDILARRLGRGHFDYLVKRKVIEALPLAYMRGHTFSNAFVLFDEAQNATATQMKLFLTRIGNSSKVVVDGDLRQRDVAGANGLEDAMSRLSRLKGVRVVEFTRDDIVRSGIAQRIVEAYET